MFGVPLAERGYLGAGSAHVAVVGGLAGTAAVLSYITQKYLVVPNTVLTDVPEAMAQTQQMMPALSALGLLVAGGIVPVALLIYWVCNAARTLAQSGSSGAGSPLQGHRRPHGAADPDPPSAIGTPSADSQGRTTMPRCGRLCSPDHAALGADRADDRTVSTCSGRIGLMGDPGPLHFALGAAFGVGLAGAFSQYAHWVNLTQRSWLQRRLLKRILVFAPLLLLGVNLFLASCFSATATAFGSA